MAELDPQDFAAAFEDAVKEDVPVVAAPVVEATAAPAPVVKGEFDTPAPAPTPVEPAPVAVAPVAPASPPAAAVPEPVAAPAAPAAVIPPVEPPAAPAAPAAVVPPVEPVAPAAPAPAAAVPPAEPVVAPAPAPVAPVVVAPAPAPVAPPVEEPKFDTPFTMSDDEKAAVAEVQKEWPDVQKGIDVLLRKQAHELENKFAGAMFQVVKAVEARLQPVQESYNEDAQTKHLNAIAEANGADWREALLPKVEAWAKTLPKVFQDAATTVLERGGTQDINDLFARYKKEAGVAVPPVAPAAPAAPAPAPVNPAVAAAAAALAPVKSGGAAPALTAGVVDKNDYNAAWATD